MPGFGFIGPLGTETFGSLTAPGGATVAQTLGIQLRIGPEPDAANYMLQQQYRLAEALNGRDELNFKLVALDGFLPRIGDEVALDWRGQRLFGGSIENLETEYFHYGNINYRYLAVDCVDWNAIADRRTIGESYVAQTAGTIVRDIITRVLAQDGVTAGTIMDGPVIARAVYNYTKISRVLDDLSERTGLHWDIDDRKVLHFFERTAVPAPFDLSATAPVRNIRVRRSRNQYRNWQYFRGGKAVTATQVESIRGDGTMRTFVVQFPLYEAPTVTRAGVPQTVGIRELERDRQWYWNKNDNTITQDPAQPVLLTTDTVTISYRGLYDIVQIVNDEAAIQDRQTVEGGSGLYEQVIIESNLDGEDVVSERNLGLLRRFATIPYEVSYETDQLGLAIGQSQNVVLIPDGVNTAHLVVGMDARDFLLGQPRFSVRLSSGEVRGTEREFWRKFFEQGNQLLVGENEFVQVPISIPEPVTVEEAWTDPVDSAAATAGIFDRTPTPDVFGECEFG